MRKHDWPLSPLRWRCKIAPQHVPSCSTYNIGYCNLCPAICSRRISLFYLPSSWGCCHFVDPGGVWTLDYSLDIWNDEQYVEFAVYRWITIPFTFIRSTRAYKYFSGLFWCRFSSQRYISRQIITQTFMQFLLMGMLYRNQPTLTALMPCFLCGELITAGKYLCVFSPSRKKLIYFLLSGNRIKLRWRGRIPITLAFYTSFSIYLQYFHIGWLYFEECTPCL